MSLPQAFVAGPAEGEAFKAGPFDIVSRVQGGQSNGVFELYELALGAATIDYHVHHVMDETLSVLEGQIEFTVAGKKVSKPAGSVAFVPRGVHHGFSNRGPARARVLMGSLWGATAATRCDSPTIYADIDLGGGGSLPIEAEADERAVMLVGGAAELDGEALEPFALYVLRPGHQAQLSSASGARAMLMGGAAFSTPRHVFWNFVSSSRDRINQAKDDWKARRFPLIPGDDQEFIPLPEKPVTVSYP